jgi:hypothetical protein
MNVRVGMVLVCIGAISVAPGLSAQLLVGRGTAVVEVVTVPPDPSRSFVFTGVPEGTVSAGDSIQATGLLEGMHTAMQRDPGPNFILTAITCDDSGSDNPSMGNIASRTAVFNIDQSESVICVFTNTASQMISETTTGSSASGSAADINPFATPDDGFEDFPAPNDLPPMAGTFAAPKAGPWDVQNFAGQMTCGGFGMPLAPGRERGELEVLDNGQTVIGTGLAEGTAQLRVTAVPGIIGRYAGSVGGEQEGIPMTIEFFWQLITDEWITGYLRSTVSQQGLTCNMFRTFELEYAGD